jgi:hypothetical protein
VQLQPTNKQTHAKKIIAFFSLSLSDQSKSHSFLFSTAPFLWSVREIKLRWRRKIAFCSASFPRPGTQKFNQNDKYSSNAPRVLGRLACPAQIQVNHAFFAAQSAIAFYGLWGKFAST